MSRHVLLTGFEPFGPHTVNPSELLVRSFEGRVIAGRTLAIRVFPSETRSLRDRLEAVLAETQPAVVLATGYAPGRAGVALERAALNLLDFDIPDAVGTMRKNDPIQRGGPDARLASFPLPEILTAWHAVGVPGYVSNSAGTYLCNQILYEALALTANASPPVLVGFVHVPALPAQAIELGTERTPSMTLDLMRKAIETALEATLTWLDAKPAQPAKKAGDKMWIPRGLREVER